MHVFTVSLSPSTDCFEEEEINALQRDSDPSLAANTIATSNSPSSSLTGLESVQGLLPIDTISGIVDDGLMANGTSFVEEFFDLDQGVAMDASDAVVSSMNNDLPSVCSPLPSTSLYSPHPPSLFTSSPYYPPPVSTTHDVSPVPDFTRDSRDVDELEYFCNTFLPNPSPLTLPHVKLSPSPHRTSNTTLIMNPQVDTYGGHQQIQTSSNSFNPQQDTIPLEAIMSLPMVASNGSKWSTSDYSRQDTDRPSGDRRRTPSPSPSYIAPSPASSVFTDYPESEFGKESLASPDIPQSFNGIGKSEIIDMPYFEFKKLLDSGSFSERDKEEVKAVRKRGKNKNAAKNCRYRKLEHLSGLQQEIDSLKGKKARLALKALSLQREIDGYKSKCTQKMSHKQQIRQLSAAVH